MYTKLYSLFLIFFLSLTTLSAQVVINEFSAANYQQYFDGFGGDEDWIELYNTSSDAFDISGYFLSDKLDNTQKWEIPAGTIIPGNGHMIFWASNKNEFDGINWHTNFKVTQTRNNESIVFADPAGFILDSHPLDIPNQAGHSRGRFPDGGSDWQVFLNPTLGNTNTNPSEEYEVKPTIELAAGFYPTPQEVTITAEAGATIYYTIDGSAPDDNSVLYTGPFMVNNTAVVKAVAYSDSADVPPSFVDFHTFFINESSTVPVISVASDQLFTLMNGTQNEPIGSLELFDESGTRVADATGDFNKHGNDSWFYDQRGIDYITRDQFGDDYSVKHPIFPDDITDRDKFQRLILKAAANDNYPYEDGAHIRDAFVHTLSQKANMHMDERTYEPCLLFVNGEYWGLYEIREKVDDHDYTDYYYDQDRDEIDFIKTWGNTWQEYGSWDDWYALTDYIANNDMSNPIAYEYVSERLDIESLVDYMILHSYNVSADWLNWNTAWWRGRDPDGGAQRWRYILWDEDATYGHYINYTFIPDQGPLADPCNIEEIDSFTDFEGHLGIFSSLYQNEEFFAYYINRYADLTNTYLGCDYMVGLLDDMIDRISPEMPRQIARWGGNVGGWENNVQELRDFMITRCEIISEGMIDCYEQDGITGPYNLEINVVPEGAGRVRANTVEGLGYPWNAIYYGDIEIELEAIANEGHAFAFWEVNNNTFGPNQFEEAIQMSLDSDDVITAYFTGFVACEEPEEVAIEESFTSADLSWIDAGGDPLVYVVRYRQLGTEEWLSVATQETEYTLQGLEFCTDYELEVESVCSNNTSETTIYNFTTDCTNNTDDLSAIVDVQVYPNPFMERFTVDLILNEGGELNWQLFNAQGQLVRKSFSNYVSSGQHRLQIDELDQLTSGVYWLHLQHNGEMQQLKLVKI